jgi:hypothetical protein
MKFLTHRDGVRLPSGTARHGSIQATMNQLVMAFGEPERVLVTSADGHSMSAHWILLFADGTHAEVYDYGRANEKSAESTTWSIGSMGRQAVDNVHAAFRGHLANKVLQFPKLVGVVDSEGGHAD